MMTTTLPLGSLVLVVFVVLASCLLATLLAVCWYQSSTPHKYVYCPQCRPGPSFPPSGSSPQHKTSPHHLPHYVNCADSATFQRLGMKCSGRGGLEVVVSQLEDGAPPVSPVESFIQSQQPISQQHQAAKYRPFSPPPTTATQTARRSVRSQTSRRSRRTLVFRSLSLPPTGGGLVEPTPDQGMERRRVRRRASERKEQSQYTVVKREEAGVTSQSEEERVPSRRYLVRGQEEIMLDTSCPMDSPRVGDITVRENKGGEQSQQRDVFLAPYPPVTRVKSGQRANGEVQGSLSKESQVVNSPNLSNHPSGKNCIPEQLQPNHDLDQPQSSLNTDKQELIYTESLPLQSNSVNKFQYSFAANHQPQESPGPQMVTNSYPQYPTYSIDLQLKDQVTTASDQPLNPCNQQPPLPSSCTTRHQPLAVSVAASPIYTTLHQPPTSHSALTVSSPHYVQAALSPQQSPRPGYQNLPNIQFRPSSNQSSQARPSPNQSSQARPSPNQSSQARPSSNQSSQARPSPNQSSQARPSSNQSSQARPPSNQSSQARPPSSQSSQFRPPSSQSSQGQWWDNYTSSPSFSRI